MGDPWKPPLLPMVIAVFTILPAALVVAALALEGSLPGEGRMIVAALMLVLGVELAIVHGSIGDVWRAQRRHLKPRAEGLVDSLEAALREAGLAPLRSVRAKSTVHVEEVLYLKRDIEVAVVTKQLGHTLYVGPWSDDTRRDIHRVKRVVDKVVADKGIWHGQ